MLYDHQSMGREFDSRRLRNSFFSSVRAGDKTNGYDSVPLDSSSVWRGEGPGDHCFNSRRDSTNSKTYILLVIKLVRYYALTDYLHVLKLIGSDCTALGIDCTAYLCNVSFRYVRVQV